MGTLPPTPHHQPPTALFGEKKIEQDPSINSLVFSYVKGIGKHMAKSPLIVIYHLCFARFQLLGAVRRPAVFTSSQKGRNDALIFQGFHAWWFYWKLIIKKNVFWNEVLHVLERYLRVFWSPFSPYILSRQRQEIQKQRLDFGDIFTKLQTSSAPQMTDSQVTSTAARQRKWCLDPCRMLPGWAGFLDPLVRLGGSRGSRG